MIQYLDVSVEISLIKKRLQINGLLNKCLKYHGFCVSVYYILIWGSFPRCALIIFQTVKLRRNYHKGRPRKK